jgi:uncharacterized protein (DUF2141 family)
VSLGDNQTPENTKHELKEESVMRTMIKLLILVLCSVGIQVLAENPEGTGTGYIVKGEISCESKGDIFLELITEEEFKQKKPAEFWLVINLTPEMSQKKTVPFEFRNVPAGRYALQCFQDTNGNEKMDSIWIIPTEPWGVYRPTKRYRTPRFKEMAFDVNKDLTDIRFVVK